MGGPNKTKECPLRVCVTGAASAIGNFLMYIIGRGVVFGKDRQILMIGYDQPENLQSVQGTAYEIQDCCLCNVSDVIWTSNLSVAFKNIDAAFLAASSTVNNQLPTNLQLLEENVSIFKDYGNALSQFAKRKVKVLIVARPQHTLTAICTMNAPTLTQDNFAAMNRLSLNRTKAIISSKLKVPASVVKNVLVWGNCSDLEIPDCRFAVINQGDTNTHVETLIDDDVFLRQHLVKEVRNRSREIFKKRKKLETVSVAKAAGDQMHDWWFGVGPGEYMSMAVASDGSYGVPNGLVFSFPVEICCGHWRIVKVLPISDFVREQIKLNVEELIEEREFALKFLCAKANKELIEGVKFVV